MATGQLRSFSTSYDSRTKVISAAICVLLAAIAIAIHSLLVAGIGAAIILLSYAFSPRAYSVTDTSILVHRLIGAVRVPLDGLQEVRIATCDDFRGAIRLWGDGGLFGYYGLFRTSSLGKCWWYVTKMQNAVVVVTVHKTALFSPDDVDGFLAAIRVAMPVSQVPPAGRFPDSHPPRFAGTRIAALFGIGIAVVVLGVVAFALTYSPGPPGYTLTAASLIIHDRFYPVTVRAADVDLAHVRVVYISGRSEWRPVERTNGFANAHYRSGWFRVANGQKVRMYWSQATRLVLLPPKGQGNAVLLEVDRPEEFVEELRREWSATSGAAARLRRYRFSSRYSIPRIAPRVA
jgi:hypothetical protein